MKSSARHAHCRHGCYDNDQGTRINRAIYAVGRFPGVHRADWGLTTPAASNVMDLAPGIGPALTDSRTRWKQRPTSWPTLPGSRTTTPSNSARKRALKDTPITTSSAPTVLFSFSGNETALPYLNSATCRRRAAPSDFPMPVSCWVCRDNYKLSHRQSPGSGNTNWDSTLRTVGRSRASLRSISGCATITPPLGKSSMAVIGIFDPKRGQYARRWTSRGRHLWGDLRLRQ